MLVEPWFFRYNWGDLREISGAGLVAVAVVPWRQGNSVTTVLSQAKVWLVPLVKTLLTALALQFENVPGR